MPLFNNWPIKWILNFGLIFTCWYDLGTWIDHSFYSLWKSAQVVFDTLCPIIMKSILPWNPFNWRYQKLYFHRQKNMCIYLNRQTKGKTHSVESHKKQDCKVFLTFKIDHSFFSTWNSAQIGLQSCQRHVFPGNAHDSYLQWWTKVVFSY